MTREMRRLVLLSLVLVAGFAVVYAVTVNRTAGNAPQQPIQFLHYVHARDKGIPCEFCHRTVKRAAYAGVPTTQFCLRCHRVEIPNFPEIRKLHGYWDRQEAVPWVRVHRLPSFVFFDHHAHTVAAKLDCTACHGDVRNMARIQQVAPLNMGWCLDCHRRKKGPTRCWTCHR